MENNRNSLMDVARGIGILSIVIGHCCYGLEIPFIHVKLGEFVYSYHLMIFFFVSGFFFKKEYVKELDKYIGKRLCKFISMLWTYNFIFVLLHNFLVDKGMISSIEIYKMSDIVSMGIRGILMKYTEELLGACWFLPMFFIGIALFAVLFSLIENNFGNKKLWGHFSVIIISALLGLYANVRGLKWEYEIQTSILAIPVIYMGYIGRQYWNEIKKRITWYGTIISFIFIVIILKLNIGIIELSVNSIINQELFYPVTIAGIYFCIGLANIINKCKLTETIFAKMGKNSFHIMALHFCGFKIVDYIYARMNEITDTVQTGRFPHSEFGLHWTYVIFSIIFSLIIVKLLDIIKDKRKLRRTDR